MTFNRKSHHNRAGATAVEFAITLPLLLLCLFATYELGRANMMIHTAEGAAYEGCRVGIVPGASAAEVRTAATQILATSGMNDVNIEITPRDLDNDTDEVSVRISFNFKDNSLIAPFLMGKAQIEKTCVMAREKL